MFATDCNREADKMTYNGGAIPYNPQGRPVSVTEGGGTILWRPDTNNPKDVIIYGAVPASSFHSLMTFMELRVNFIEANSNELPKEPDINDPIERWYEWYKRCKVLGFKVTHKIAAGKKGIPEDTFRKGYSRYKKRHKIVT
jgi:hypothetical protein